MKSPLRDVSLVAMALGLVLSTSSASVVLQNWQSSPWNGMSGQTSLSATVTDPALAGGASAVVTFSEPRTGVNVSDPANPNFAVSSASFFGFEGTGFGVGDVTVGRFNTGESVTLQVAHDFRLESITWMEFTGDEALHVRWTQGGTLRTEIFAVNSWIRPFVDLVADADTPVVITNVSGTAANAAGRLRFSKINIALVVPETLPAVGGTWTLQGWTGTPWNGVSGMTAFSATLSDPVHGPVAFSFSDPRKAVDVAIPAAPNAAPSTASFFGFEGTGFGVGENGLGRYERGERFVLQSDKAFQLQGIRLAEYNSDEALHISWVSGGTPKSQVLNFGPGLFYTLVPVSGVYADANTPLVITNVSSPTAVGAGRLRVNRLDLALLTDQTVAPPEIEGSQLVLAMWNLWPWTLASGATSLSGTFTAPENGGTPAAISWSNPRRAVSVTNPASPDFTPSVASFFGFESTGFGVGENGLGRFDRGESFTLQCGHAFKWEEVMWREYNGDEQLHIRWTRDGVERQQVFAVTNPRMEFADLVADPNTPVVVTNVSGTAAIGSGRLRLEYAIARLMFVTEPQYDASGSDGFVQMSGVNLAGAEFGGFAFYPTEPEQFDYYLSKGQKLMRIPFKWERIQPALGGPLNISAMNSLNTVVALARDRGMKVILDMHNYGRYNGNSNVIGGTVPVSAFKDVWKKLAEHFANDPAIYGYGIMNEPHGMNGAWPAASQAAVDGIREEDSSTWIIVAGENWSSASAWRSSNANLSVADPQNKVMYEAHCYFDSTGTKGDGVYEGTFEQDNPNPNVGVLRSAPFILWLQERGARGFFGEYGVPKNEPRWHPILDRFMKYTFSNGTSGTYWAGGMHWTASSLLNCSPTNNYTTDAAVMEVLEDYVY